MKTTNSQCLQSYIWSQLGPVAPEMRRGASPAQLVRPQQAVGQVRPRPPRKTNPALHSPSTQLYSYSSIYGLNSEPEITWPPEFEDLGRTPGSTSTATFISPAGKTQVSDLKSGERYHEMLFFKWCEFYLYYLCYRTKKPLYFRVLMSPEVGVCHGLGHWVTTWQIFNPLTSGFDIDGYLKSISYAFNPLHPIWPLNIRNYDGIEIVSVCFFFHFIMFEIECHFVPEIVLFQHQVVILLCIPC